MENLPEWQTIGMTLIFWLGIAPLVVVCAIGMWRDWHADDESKIDNVKRQRRGG